MPLKGTILHKMYPSDYLREMADTDVLVDVKQEEAAKTIMESLGYDVIQYGKYVHDVYQKPPIYDVELHMVLFSKDFNGDFGVYYENVWDRLVKKEENSTEYCFTDEDFYVYLIAHMSKHLEKAGTGIRSLADIYVFLSSKPDVDKDKIETELQKIGISDIEKCLRSLSFKIFSNESHTLTDEEKALLDEIGASGTYGTLKQSVSKELKKIAGEGEKVTLWTKIKFLFKRLFPGAKPIKEIYPVCKKHPILVPVYTVVRWTKIFKKRKSIKNEIKLLKNSK